jgi:CheY-like chemotaxis protein
MAEIAPGSGGRSTGRSDPWETILVVDDEKNIRRTLQLVLEGEGYKVVSAETAEAGLSLLAEPQ